MTALHHSFGFVQDDLGDLHVTLCRLVEGGSDDLGVHASRHVGDLFGTLVDEQDDHVHFGVIGCDGIGNVLEEHRLTRLGLRYDQAALSFAYGGEEVYDADGYFIVYGTDARCFEGELLFGEEGCEMIEGHAVADLFGAATVHTPQAARRGSTSPPLWADG